MRLAVLAAVTLLTFAGPTYAADEKPKPNTLTPKEIADGWLSLFDGETTFGWKIDGAAEVKDGALVIGRGKKTIAYPTTRFGPAYELKLEWQGEGAATFGKTVIEGGGKVDPTGEWGEIKYSWDGKVVRFSFSVEGSVNRSLSEPGDPGQPPLTITTNGKTYIAIRSVKLRPLNASPIFNGKDLSGWKVNAPDAKRSATRFTVTKDGELSARNGPGDLVTEKEFDNFVLQLECKSLGEGLNSGIFFRCIPGQYQNGYEAQIHNGIVGNDPTKPKDGGTGAIYRRVPARKVVSKDHEWLTMTVVADGKHFATWVNGYQTVDWTDDRKADENPRQGYRAAKGPISIQGHDPTTDLLFRNIRIAELPAAEKK